MSPLVSPCAQHCSDERNFADSGKMCSGVVILGLILALVLVQESQHNRPQHIIDVRLANQVSHYNHQICRPWFLTSPEGHGKPYCTKPMFDPNIEILRKME